jgi:hypothetical protein
MVLSFYLCCMHGMPRRCRRVNAAPLFILEQSIEFLEVLHITYSKTTLIKGPFGTSCGSHETTRQRRGSGVAAARHSVHQALRRI